MAYPTTEKGLEDYFQAGLEDSHLRRQRGDGAGSGYRDVAVRCSEVRMVEDVEAFETQLDLAGFA